MRITRSILVLPIRLYRRVISPILTAVAGPACRFSPSCSEYAIDAIQQHGALRGTWLATRRVCRCHPWGGCGHDPVPPAPVGGERGVRLRDGTGTYSPEAHLTADSPR